jgi:NDP-sugar pyrophosphorylase family protein
MRRAVLIAPGERPGVAYLGQSAPLVNLPVLGEPVIHHWFESLLGAGVREVELIITDRPDQVQALVGDGSRWGLEVSCRVELQELSLEAVERECRKARGQVRVILLDHLPGMPLYPLFASYEHWFAAVKAWLLASPKQHRLGLRQVRPGVWVSRGAQIAPSAVLEGPCWIGENVRVGAQARVGPNAILESRILVEMGAEIVESMVGPDTFVGALTRIEESVAWGNSLINWRNGSCLQVPDSFLLCPLSQFAFRERGPIFRFCHLLGQLWRSLPRVGR